MNQIFRNIILFFLLNVLISSTDQNSVSNLFDFISIDDKQNQINFEELKDKINDLNNIIRRQDNKILYMNYKADSLKIVLFEHLIAFDEYKRDMQNDIDLLKSNLKSETSRRKSDDRKINKTISKENKKLKKQIQKNGDQILKINNDFNQIKESVSTLEIKIDRIKEKYFMDEDEYIKYRQRNE